MRTDVAVEKICNITPIVGDVIAKMRENEELKSFLLAYKADKSNKVFVLKIFPLLMKFYKEEIFEILAILNDLTVEEVKEQEFGKTFVMFQDLYEDKDLMSFFTLFITKKKKKEAQAE